MLLQIISQLHRSGETDYHELWKQQYSIFIFLLEWIMLVFICYLLNLESKRHIFPSDNGFIFQRSTLKKITWTLTPKDAFWLIPWHAAHHNVVSSNSKTFSKKNSLNKEIQCEVGTEMVKPSGLGLLLSFTHYLLIYLVMSFVWITRIEANDSDVKMHVTTEDFNKWR